jgi:hypothetical protein
VQTEPEKKETPESEKPRIDPRRKPRDAKPAQPKVEETEKERIRREAEGLFGKPGEVVAGAPASGPKGWSVVLGVFRGDERESASRVYLNRVRTEGGLPEAYAIQRNEAIVVAVGDFEGADLPDARAELKRVQEMQIGGVEPYRQAFMSPPSVAQFTGGMPQYHLTRAHELFGKDALYTLQVGVYGRLDLAAPKEADLAEARKAAEQAVFRLRQEGELAFYYHSPTMSMVTIGVFDLKDFDPQVPGFQSPRLLELKRRFPNNLYNGAGIKQRVKGGPEMLQPSMLVGIPKT